MRHIDRHYKASRAGKKLVHLLHHDALTGLFNRYHLDRKLKEIESRGNLLISIIMGDLQRRKRFPIHINESGVVAYILSFLQGRRKRRLHI